MGQPAPPGFELDAFYGLLDQLSDRVGGPRRLADCHGRMRWPERGVYFFFEPGEARRDGKPRVVRVGTHALTATSKTTLWKRLAQHRGSATGSGNHRGSIFRLHVGTALMAADPILADDPAAATWGRGSTRPPEAKDNERHLEQLVSHYIGQMPFLWLAVDDPGGPASDRGLIEASSIALLSNNANPNADPPSPNWLGHHADRDAVRNSGLWNVNHVHDPVHPDFLSTLQHWTLH